MMITDSGTPSSQSRNSFIFSVSLWVPLSGW